MATSKFLTTITEGTPIGRDKGQVLDENIRDFKTATVSSLKALSFYPYHEAIKTQVWADGDQPVMPAPPDATVSLEGLTGWNTTKKMWERRNETGWEVLGYAQLASWNIAGRPTSASERFDGRIGYNTELVVIERWSQSSNKWERIGGLARGVIMMWSGTVATIPTGWVLCDGGQHTIDGATFSTVDLRNRFIVGAGQDGGTYTPGVGSNTMGTGYYAPAAVGGEDKHTLTTSEIPAHTHLLSYQTTRSWETGGGSGINYSTGTVASTNLMSFAQQTTTDQPHENRPLYYALCFIYKL